MSSVDISNIVVSVAPVDLYLPQFNGAAALSLLAQLGVVTPDAMDASAVCINATGSITAEDMKDVFKFSVDNWVNFVAEAPNGNETDLHYYVMSPESLVQSDYKIGSESVVQVAGGTVGPAASADARTGTSFTSAQMRLPQDYIRYLAKEIFGTTAGVDLFYNETPILGDIVTQIQDIWNSQNVGTTLEAIKADAAPGSQGANMILDISNGLYCFDNQTKRSANICQVLFDQLLTLDPERFTVGGAASHNLLEAVESSAPQSLPFISGDSISFVYALSPHAGQEKLVDGLTNIPTRTYRIKLILQ